MVSFKLFFTNKQNVELVLLFHTLAFCCRLKFWKLLQWTEWYGATGENRNFEYKEDKIGQFAAPICKGKPYLKLSKLILNWTVRKN